MKTNLPEWLRVSFQRALLGEIYPAIRAIAVAFDGSRKLTIRYYLDREPTDFDRDSLSMVVASIYADTSSNSEIPAVAEECVHAQGKIGTLDALDAFVYARREYDITKENGA